MDQTLVGYRAEGGVAVLELCDPPANTYSYPMMRALDDAVLRARFDESVHVLVLTGAGDKLPPPAATREDAPPSVARRQNEFFCAGADIKMLAASAPAFKYNFCLHANETLLRLENTPKLCIAALNGHCVGGGLEVALAADLRIARKGGGKIGLPEVTLGVLPGTGGTQRLARLAGKARAMELMIEGRLLSPEDAQALGLVNFVFESDGFMDRVLDYARKFVPPAKAALAVGRIKRAVQAGAEVPLESGLALERELQQLLFQSGDAREGIAAYVEKRPPSFEGK